MIGISAERVSICGSKSECKSKCIEEIISFYNAFRDGIQASFIEINGCYISAKSLLVVPIVLHCDSLVKNKSICRLELSRTRSWIPYKKFVKKNKVLAMVVNPPLQSDCSLQELNNHTSLLSTYLGVPVFVRTSESEEYWCSSMETVADNLAIDTDDVLAWNNGDSVDTAREFHQLLSKAGLIYLSYPVNLLDVSTEATPKPPGCFYRYIDHWAGEKFVIHKPILINQEART